MADGAFPSRLQRQTAVAEVTPYGALAPAASAAHPFDRPLEVLRRFKWLIAASVLIGSLSGVGSTKLIAPQYNVRATVWIASETDGARARSGPIRPTELLSSAAWIELFRSFRIVDEVVRKLKLYLHPANAIDAPLFADFSLSERYRPGSYELIINGPEKSWQLRASKGEILERGLAADAPGAKLGYVWTLPPSVFDEPAERRVPFVVATPRETSLSILGRLETRLAMGSNFLWLSYSDASPQRAARTLNTWLAEFIRVAADLKKRNVLEFANILEGQLRFAEKATQDAEQAYEHFRVNTITLPTEAGPVAAGIEITRDPALQSFFDQKIEYDNLRRDREALEKSIANAATGSTSYEGVLLIPSVAAGAGAEALRDAFRRLYEAQARLQSERQHFTDQYPTVKELIASVETYQTKTIPDLSRQLLSRMRERETDYVRRIQGASRELQQIPPRTIEEMRLKRAVSVAEGLYTNLKGRYAEARLAEASATPDVSVLDTAVAPVAPSRNTAPRMVLFAIVGSLAFGIGLALLIDRLDRRIRYTEQATSELGLPIAGAVPRIPARGINEQSPEQVMHFVEAFRSLRMHVLHSAASRPIRLAVTSAAPGDGKSLVSANLALSFADAGLRTVLVDGDMRRGTLHRLFGMPLAGGLTEYLSGDMESTALIRPTTHEHLAFISSGKRHSRSPELLARPRLQQLIHELTTAFDVVIIDTPPLAAGIDGYALSAAAGEALMVLRLGQTVRRLVSAKLAVLDRLPVNVLGAVINAVHLGGEFQYYSYAHGYSIDTSENGVDQAHTISATSRGH